MVYAVTAPALGSSERALKLLIRGAGEESARRFRREAELLASVRHPGVVAIHEVGEAEQGLYLVMDLVPGEPLDHVLRRGSATPEQARRWILEAAEAVGALHDQGLLHRDLKPANLILRPDGRLVLLDFGLARSASGTSLTETGGITGSPGFLAPEQARGEKALTPAVDVHGLGTTLFAFLNGGAPPFRGATTLATLAAVLDQEAAWPPELPESLLAVGRRALAKEPSERYPDARAFALALQEEAAPGPPPDKARGLWLALAGALALLVASGAWALGARVSAAPQASPALAAGSPSPGPGVPDPSAPSWEPLPREPGPRAEWFREVWRRQRAGEVPTREVARDLRRVLADSVLGLSVTSSESPLATFWGSERWVRRRAAGLDWGLVRSPRQVEGRVALQASGEVEVHVAGEVLTFFELEPRPKAWRLRGPGLEPRALTLPAATFLEGGLECVAHEISEERLSLATARQVWELDLEAPEGFRCVYELQRGLIEELAYGPQGQLVVGYSALDRAGLRFTRGPAGALVAGVPTRLEHHPSLPLLAVGDKDGRVLLWDYEAGSDTTTLRGGGETHQVRGLLFDPEGDLLYSTAALTSDGDGTGDERGQVQVWRRSAEGWRATRRIELPWTPKHMALSPEGAWLLVSRRRGQVLLYAAGDSEGP